MSVKTKLFLVLFIAGMLGVLSILLIDIPAIVELLPASAKTDVPPITALLKLLSMVQPAVILAVGVLIGVLLAPKVMLHAPVAEALVSGGSIASTLKPQVVPGLIGGLLGAISIVATSAIFKPFLSTQIVERIAKFQNILPIPTRLLYGGIYEELLLRWGFMTLLVWLGWRFLQKGYGAPKLTIVIGSIMASAFLFAIGHLGIAFLLIPESPTAIFPFAIIANSAFGLIAGFLYWRKGLESAIIAHTFCHVWLIIATLAKIY